MNQFWSIALLWGLAGVAVSSALVVVFVRDVMRMVLGLGVFFLSLAGLFAYFAFGFLALAELFVYVGGVLVLILFAIMLVHRSEAGRPSLDLREAFVPGFTAALSSILLGFMFWPLAKSIGPVTSPGAPEALGRVLTGSLLSQFEIAGFLLLVALVAVVLVTGGDRS